MSMSVVHSWIPRGPWKDSGLGQAYRGAVANPVPCFLNMGGS